MSQKKFNQDNKFQTDKPTKPGGIGFSSVASPADLFLSPLLTLLSPLPLILKIEKKVKSQEYDVANV